jgi:hypothetical protein
MKALPSILIMSLLLLALSASGCTLIGFGLGAAMDGGARKEVSYPPSVALRFLDEGDSVRCVMTDSSRIAGTMAESSRLSHDSVVVLRVAEDALRPDSAVRLTTLQTRDIARIEYRRHIHDSKFVLGACGLLIDIGIIFALANWEMDLKFNDR